MGHNSKYVRDVRTPAYVLMDIHPHVHMVSNWNPPKKRPPTPEVLRNPHRKSMRAGTHRCWDIHAWLSASFVPGPGRAYFAPTPDSNAKCGPFPSTRSLLLHKARGVLCCDHGFCNLSIFCIFCIFCISCIFCIFCIFGTFCIFPHSSYFFTASPFPHAQFRLLSFFCFFLATFSHMQPS